MLSNNHHHYWSTRHFTNIWNLIYIINNITNILVFDISTLSHLLWHQIYKYSHFLYIYYYFTHKNKSILLYPHPKMKISTLFTNIYTNTMILWFITTYHCIFFIFKWLHRLNIFINNYHLFSWLFWSIVDNNSSYLFFF